MVASKALDWCVRRCIRGFGPDDQVYMLSCLASRVCVRFVLS